MNFNGIRLTKVSLYFRYSTQEKGAVEIIGELTKNHNYRKRLKYFRDTKILSPEYVEVAAIKLREHIIDPKTQLIKGTFGKNREARRKNEMKLATHLKPLPHQKGFLLYNPETKVVAFYDEKNRKLVTYLTIMKLRKEDEILLNHNLT